jgi:VIT1/CCC1 family predicted Fe2+/Mn2+ transporter
MSEALSDDGELTGRGASTMRGLITGCATFVGGAFHTLPFLISDVDVALAIAYAVVGSELVVIAFIRKRYLQVSLTRSLLQITLGGAIVAAVGILLGHG